MRSAGSQCAEVGRSKKNETQPFFVSTFKPDPEGLAKRRRVNRVPPTSQVGERDAIEARIVRMLDELFHNNGAGGCGCSECDPEEEGHEEDCDCGGRGPSGSWAFRRGEHVAQLRAKRAAGISRWREAAFGMRA